MAAGPSSTAVEIPDKLYFRIGEVASLTGVKAHTLRYWETEFGRLRPEKSGSGQRRYTRADIELVLRIKDLLWARRFTIAGARAAIARGEEKEPLPLPEPPAELLEREARAEEQAAALAEREGAVAAREELLLEREGVVAARGELLVEREGAVAAREELLSEREVRLEARLRQAQEALAARQAEDQRRLESARQEQLHELDMLRTRARLLEERGEAGARELQEVQLREARMTRAMAQVRRGIIELRHRLHEAGQDGT